MSNLKFVLSAEHEKRFIISGPGSTVKLASTVPSYLNFGLIKSLKAFYDYSAHTSVFDKNGHTRKRDELRLGPELGFIYWSHDLNQESTSNNGQPAKPKCTMCTLLAYGQCDC